MGEKEITPPQDDYKIKNRIEMLNNEYLMLQEFYEDIDRRCFTIKGWSITVAAGAIGASLIYGKEVLLWVALASSLVFWYLEAKWRGLSYFFAVRIKQIEAAFRAGEFEKLTPFQVYHVWDEAFDKVHTQTGRYLFKPLTPMPHAVVALISLVIVILVHLGVVVLAGG